MRRRTCLLVLIVLALIALSGCAPGPNPQVGGQDVAGFWQGLWHGFIALFTFVISLFNDRVSMYEVSNNGGWYNFGYLVGVMMFWGGGGSRASRR